MARRHLLQWAFCAALLVVLIVAAGLYLSADREARLDAATRELSASAAAAQRLLTDTLDSAGHAAEEARRLTLTPADGAPPAKVAEQFGRIEQMIPGLRTLLWLDRQGVALAANRPELVGRDLSARSYFKNARDRDDPDLVQVTEPYLTVLGAWTLNLVVSRRDASGAFDGLVLATLDPQHLLRALSAIHRPGHDLALVHGSGIVLVRLAQAPGRVQDLPPAVDDWLSGVVAKAVSVGLPSDGLQTVAVADGRRRLVALQPLVVQGLRRVEGSLVLAMAADEASVLQAWRLGATTLWTTLSLVAAAVAAGLAYSQRTERREHDRMEREHDTAIRVEAERRRLATMQAVAARVAQQAGWSIDARSGEALWTAELRAMIGVDGSVVASVAGLVERLDPGGHKGLAAAIEAVRAQGTPFDRVLEFDRPDGERRFVRLVAQATHDDDGAVATVEGAAADVTELARAMAALRRNESLFRGIFDNAAVGIAVLDADGNTRRTNRRLAEMLGWSNDELDGLPGKRLIHPDDQVREREDWAAMAAGTTAGYAGEKRLACRDGSWRWTWVALSAVRDEQHRLVQAIAVVEDIAERKAAEASRERLAQELRESQKMEAIGTLAGGVAHDFNNVLGVMLANAEVLRTAECGDKEAAEALDQIFKAGLIGRSLVERVLSFSRRQPGTASALDLRDVVRETAALLRSTMPASVALTTDLPGEAAIVQGAPQQLQQVLLNLCTNALQAIGERAGRIGIVLRLQHEGGRPVRAQLEVSDDGCGMPESVRARVFEPFFTTKPVGQGTGLGLAVVRSIVQEHAGTIEVDSAPGAGTRVTVTLPCRELPVASEPAAPTPAPVRPGQGELIVYVDDNRMMGASARRLLERAGYRVATFTTAADALRALADPGFQPAAIVSDFSMPDISGLELVDRLPPARQGLPVAIISGFVSDELLAEAARRGIRFVLRKEDSFRELPATVARLLEAHSRPALSPAA